MICFDEWHMLTFESLNRANGGGGGGGGGGKPSE